ncbi:hypothetical protein [Jatrophihabitans sp.]|uniref:hypothetical protein n=1 Tax=Jatrophihabitans sp. TaxID=1932789 RepID=UPI0030C70C73|nr:hypothetical protein [Jatrophihabitans sp.]
MRRLKYNVLVARYKVRRWLEQFDNPQLRNARRLLRVLRSTSQPDVVYIGDSTVSFTAPGDVDKRRLSVMVDEFLPDQSLFAIFGGSYHADLIADYVNLIGLTGARPVLVVPLWIRGRYVPWIEHPVFGHKRAMAYLRTIRRRTPTRSIRQGFPAPSAQEFAEFYALRHKTFLGDLPIGDYINPLKDRDRWKGKEDERVRMLHAYHHGAALTPGSPAMDAVVKLGRAVRELGCPVVVYQTPVPVESGVGYFGEEFADLARANFAALDAAFTEGLGRPIEIIQSGTIFPTSEFIDVAGADEHLNEAGRRRLAALIATAVGRELDARGQTGQL